MQSKLQAAMEYLITYSWAILIMGIVLVAYFALNQLNPNVSSECILPASSFSCISYVMAQNGLLTLNLLQTTQDTISVNAIGCNTNQTTAHMTSFNTKMLPDTNATFSVQCYSVNSAYSLPYGSAFIGDLAINYTDQYTGYNAITYGQMIVKVTK